MTAAGALVAGGILSGCRGARPSPIVRTQAGEMQGEITEGIQRFLGVPYAEPPLGQ